MLCANACWSDCGSQAVRQACPLCSLMCSGQGSSSWQPQCLPSTAGCEWDSLTGTDAWHEGASIMFFESHLHLRLVQRVPRCVPKCVCLSLAALSSLSRTGSGTCSVALPVKCQRKQFNSYTDLLQLKNVRKAFLAIKASLCKKSWLARREVKDY